MSTSNNGQTKQIAKDIRVVASKEAWDRFAIYMKQHSYQSLPEIFRAMMRESIATITTPSVSEENSESQNQSQEKKSLAPQNSTEATPDSSDEEKNNPGQAA